MAYCLLRGSICKMNVHSCILVRLLHLFVFSTAQTVPQSTRSACRIPVLMQSSLKMNPPLIEFQKTILWKWEWGGVVGCHLFRRFFDQLGFPIVGEVKDGIIDVDFQPTCQDRRCNTTDNSSTVHPKIPELMIFSCSTNTCINTLKRVCFHEFEQVQCMPPKNLSPVTMVVIHTCYHEVQCSTRYSLQRNNFLIS